MASENAKLTVSTRAETGSRPVRRLRREGLVPGVVYGHEAESRPVKVAGRELHQAIVAGGAVIDLRIDSGKAEPVIVKEQQFDPVRGDLVHVDFLRVRLDEEITATVPIELVNADQAPGVKEGGVLEHVTREIEVEALPNAIPDAITVDVSGMGVAETLTLSEIAPPGGVAFLDDAGTLIATITAATKLEEPEEVEEEIEVVGEEVPAEEAAAEAAEGAAEGATEGEGG